MRERDVENYLVRRIASLGGVAFKFTSPGRRSVPDRICLLPGGRLVFVECKAPGKEPTDGQWREMKRLTDLGQRTFVVSSKESVDRLMELIK